MTLKNQIKTTIEKHSCFFIVFFNTLYKSSERTYKIKWITYGIQTFFALEQPIIKPKVLFSKEIFESHADQSYREERVLLFEVITEIFNPYELFLAFGNSFDFIKNVAIKTETSPNKLRSQKKVICKWKDLT